jgi:NAD-dependent deacetylase
MLPEQAWSDALKAVEDCDFFLSVGTSGMVYPAAELPLRALGNGATVVHVNPVLFDVSSQEHFLEGTESQMVPTLIRCAFPGVGH